LGFGFEAACVELGPAIPWLFESDAGADADLLRHELNASGLQRLLNFPGRLNRSSDSSARGLYPSDCCNADPGSFRELKLAPAKQSPTGPNLRRKYHF